MEIEGEVREGLRRKMKEREMRGERDIRDEGEMRQMRERGREVR